MNRRSFLLTVTAAGLAGRTSAQTLPSRIEVYKSPTCGCCSAWIDHMARAGFAVDAQDIDQDALYALKVQSGITPELASCHTALVDGYVVEGHVPAADVERLLAERPSAIGLSVPGMPYGSPGMGPEERRERYDVFLIGRNGGAEVFATYDAA